MKYRIAAAEEAFASNSSYHDMPTKDLIKALKVSKTTITKFRKKYGVKAPDELHRQEIKRRTEIMVVSPEFGKKEGICQLPLPQMAKKFGVSVSTVQRMQRIHGVLSNGYHKTQGLGINPRETPKALKNLARRLLKEWTRPPGMDAHLEYLREQR